MMEDTHIECGITCTCRPPVPPPDPPPVDTNVPVIRPTPDQSGPMLQRLKQLRQALLNKPGGLRGKSYVTNPDALSDPEHLQVVVYDGATIIYSGLLSGWNPTPLHRGMHIEWAGGGIFWDPND